MLRTRLTPLLIAAKRRCLSTHVPAVQRVDRWLSDFSAGLTAGCAHESFAPERSFWRDMVAFTWSIRTFEGAAHIGQALAATSSAAQPHGWCADGTPTEDATDGSLECWLRFRTAAGGGKALLKLDKQGKASSLFTSLSDLDARPFATDSRRALGHPCESIGEIATPRPGRRYWHERRATALPAALGGEAGEPYVLIVGGGQGGLSLGARLQLLGVPYVIIEADARVGDSWRKRYPGLMLHDPVWYDHLPYMPFPASWPVFTPRDKLADWLQHYATAMDLNVATSTRVTRAVPPADGGGGDGRWEVELQPGGSASSGGSVTLRPAHVVLATGMSGVPRVPATPAGGGATQDAFDGEVMHSSAYPGAGGGRFAGRRAVVVGSNTSAHDICQDLWEQGAHSVTMLQRSAGLVVSETSVLSHGLGSLYSEGALERGVTTELADLAVASAPLRLQEEKWRECTARMRHTDASLHAGLTAAGYKLDFGEDDTGIFGKSFRRGGGFYIDVGCASLLSDGRVGLRSGSGAEIAQIEPSAVRLRSGEALPADLLVYATGFESMQHFVSDLVSPAVAARVGRVWGYGSGAHLDPGPWDGELRNMWRPTAQPGLWFSGGNLAQARHYSRLVALQLAARYDGLATPVYSE